MEPEAEERLVVHPPPPAELPPPPEPGYSVRNELNFFFKKGLPLGAAAVLEWGLPPLMAMCLAGQTKQSAALQSALGYGRVFYNTTMLMVMLALCSYIGTVLPGCIGAGRRDRIPDYFRRSVAVCTVLLVPSTVLQLFSGLIMRGLGVHPSIADDVQTYTCWMVISSLLLLVEIHVEAVFVNLDFAHLATLNSLVTGLGVDVLCSYFLIYRLELGVRGAAYTQIIVKCARLLIWMVFAVRHGLVGLFLGCGRAKEPLITRKEMTAFGELATSSLMSNFAGWFIYELQIICMARVPHISQSALAAGAVWIQLEGTLAAVQNGWITATSIRTLQLLGQMDPGASRGFAILCLLSGLLVAVTNIPFLACSHQIARLLSNDAQVRRYLSDIIWVLAVHAQTRISCINANSLFIPIGKGKLGVAMTFVSFYLLVAPLGCVLSLTDLATSNVTAKLTIIVAATSVGQLAIALMGFIYLARLDWVSTALVINDRANSDKPEPYEPILLAGEPRDSPMITGASVPCGSPSLSPASLCRTPSAMSAGSLYSHTSNEIRRVTY